MWLVLGLVPNDNCSDVVRYIACDLPATSLYSITTCRGRVVAATPTCEFFAKMRSLFHDSAPFAARAA
jgi:hypothetical protein